jgi:PAS domain S-box-containing protein
MLESVSAAIDINHPTTESEHRYCQIVQGLPTAFYTCDPEGRIKLYNKAAATLWGRQPDVNLDRWCGSWKICRTDGSALPQEEHPMAIAIREGRPVQGHEIIIERPDGSRRYVMTHPVPIFDSKGRLAEAVNTLVDITDQKAIREVNEELAKSNNDLEQFAYVASHDLQEPLRKIRIFGTMVEKHLEDAEKAGYYLDKISASAGRMMTLIQDLLNFSRLNISGQPLAEVDLNGILEHIRSDLELFIHEKGAEIVNEPLPVIQGEPLQLYQLFYNIINNSLKFSSPEVPPGIHISTRVLQAEELSVFPCLDPALEYVEILLKDNGIGFAQEYAEQIFTIFHRLNDRQAYTGTGIGLALCKKIVTNHHGHIYALSKEAEGAAFYVILPRTQRRERPACP